MTQAPTHHRSRGFTLIEVMMVVVLVGVITAVVAFSISPQSGQRALDREAVDLESVIDQIMEDASIRHLALGVSVAGNKLLVWQYDEKQQQWSPASSFTEHELPEGLALSVQTEDREGTEPTSNSTGTVSPDFLVLPTGEVTPVRLLLKEASGLALSLRLDELGRVTRENDDTENG